MNNSYEKKLYQPLGGDERPNEKGLYWKFHSKTW